MANKTQSKRPIRKRIRETKKRGGKISEKSFFEKRTQAMEMIEELMEFATLNQSITTKICKKVSDIKDLYTDDSSESQEKDTMTMENISRIGLVDENRMQGEPLSWLPDIESILTQNLSVNNNERINGAKIGTWDFYLLDILNSEPKTENELSILMNKKYPDKMKGKTPDNTLNYRLQKLVKDGNAKRIEYKKGKRNAYKYYV